MNCKEPLSMIRVLSDYQIGSLIFASYHEVHIYNMESYNIIKTTGLVQKGVTTTIARKKELRKEVAGSVSTRFDPVDFVSNSLHLPVKFGTSLS